MFDKRLVELYHFDINRLCFSEMENKHIPGTDFFYKKVKIQYLHPETNTCSDFVLKSPKNMFCFGLNENISNSKRLIGYHLSISLYNKNNIDRNEENLFIKILQEITEKVRNYLIDHREVLEINNMKHFELRNLSPIWKKSSAKLNTLNGMLYLKCYYDKFNNEIKTLFINEEDKKQVNPLSCINKHMKMKTAIQIDSILISPEKINIQMKATECSFIIPHHRPLLF